jgi:23S rRNA (cytosine1962-C5)-methyltransferase
VVLRGGPPVHPFVYSKRLLRVGPGARDGDLVRVLTREGRPCAWGFLHTRSLIAVRVLSGDPDTPPDGAWLRRRLAAAEALRRDVLRLGEDTDAWRVVHAEGDGLSGLVVDRYGSVASASLYSLGWYVRREELDDALREVLGCDRVVLRTDARTSEQEGFTLAEEDRVGAVEIHEHGVRYGVDLAAGHKTGFFLDQRDHRRLLARVARGRRVFDGMTYTGGFALAAAKGGAASVRGMDLDEEAVALARENAARNGVDVRFDHGDTFDALRAYAAGPEHERPEVVVVDPPKWAKDRAGFGAALAKYRDLNRLAIQAVAPDGLVFTHSCSGLVQEHEFLGVLADAARDLGTDVRFLHVGGAAPDHPVRSSFPEGRYLKSVLLATEGHPRHPVPRHPVPD